MYDNHLLLHIFILRFPLNDNHLLVHRPIFTLKVSIDGKVNFVKLILHLLRQYHQCWRLVSGENVYKFAIKLNFVFYSLQYGYFNKIKIDAKTLPQIK